MFTVETNARGTYQTLTLTESEVNAVSVFSDALDQRRSSESVRVLRDGELMARKTPKGHFFHNEWAERADRAFAFFVAVTRI